MSATRFRPAPRALTSVRAQAACLLAVVLAACDALSPAAPVAELTGRAGAVERDFAAQPERWSDAVLGARFQLGDGLRTAEASTAQLELAPAGTALVAPNTVVRFSADAPGEPAQHIVLEAGSIELATDRFEVVVHTPRALARFARRSRAKLSASDDKNAQITVAVGGVTLVRQGEGRGTELSAGQSMRLLGAGALDEADASRTLAEPAPEIVPLAPEAAAAAPEPAPAPPPAASAIGAPAADVRLSASERAIVHAAQLPVRVALVLPPCSAETELQIGEQRSAGARGVANVQLSGGRHAVVFRCAAVTRAEGAIEVRREDPRAALTGSPASVPVDTDGRRYRVRHSGTPPSLEVRWSGARGPGPYVLSLRGGARSVELTSDRPARVLRAEELVESPIALTFRNAAGASSPVTTVDVSVDETTQLLAWQAPLERSARRGSRIAVRGRVLPGSRIRFGNEQVPVDADGHFAGLVAPPGPGGALVAEVTHPLLGRHYYVRRLR